MKKLKRIMALVIAMAMVLSMNLAAFAAGHGSITINNAESNHKYTAYQILKGTFGDGKLSDVDWGDDITAAGKTALYTKYGLTGENQTAAKVAEAIAASTTNTAATAGDSKAIEFANTVDTNVSGGKTGSLSGTTYTISDLDDGYYMIVDTWTGDATAVQGEDYTLARYMVQLVGTAEVNNKADKPTVDKEIVDAPSQDKNSSTANIGDTVDYKVTSKVPEYAGYKEYYMNFTDTLSKGLTFKNGETTTTSKNGVTVKIGGATVSPDAYDVIVGDYSETDGTSIQIKLKDLVSRKYTVGAAIEITYAATVNDAAVIGNTGNPNTVKLNYSNKPLNSGNGTPDDDIPGDVTGETPNSEVTTFVTEIELTKIDADDTTTKLAGAVFKVNATSINKVLITGEEFVEDASGTYYKLTDGKYTTEEPTTATASQYASQTIKYKKQAYATTSEQEAANQEFEVVTGADGIIKISGLKEGTYTFTEIQAPDGYNLLSTPITVVVKSNIATITKPADFAWDKDTGSSDSVTVDNGTFKFQVENNSGTQLPSTGGIGTTIFYVVGAILVIGAGVVLITRRRMEA